MILVIEDEFDIRERRLKELGLGQDFVIAWDSSTGMQALRPLPEALSKWDAIWWDHDLGGDDTSYPVALMLAEMIFHEVITPDLIPICVIHTANPVGREHLKMLFKRWHISYKEVWM